jgi:hypothetical protein
MKRESNVRRTLATAVAIFVLLGTAPVYGRANKERRHDLHYGNSPLVRLALWVQSRIVPPMPEPDPEPTNGRTSGNDDNANNPTATTNKRTPNPK